MLEDGWNDVIRKARMGQGLSIEVLAQACGLSPAELERFEAGTECLDVRLCRMLAGQLGLEHQALWKLVQGRYRPSPHPVAGYDVSMMRVGTMQTNAYLISRAGSKDALLVDPGGEPQRLRAAAQGRRLVALLVTHGHHDHVGALEELASQLRLPVMAHPAESPLDPDISLLGEGRYTVEDLVVDVLSCPGHTANGCAFLVGGAVFTGDTLFAGSLGRAASQATYGQLLASGRRLLELAADRVLYPGHGPATTVEQERRHSPFLAHWFA